MSDKYKILSQQTLASSSPLVIYTVPVIANKTYGSVEVSPKAVSSTIQTLMTSVIFSFDGASGNVAGDLELSDSGAAYEKLITNLSFYDNQSTALNLNMTLPEGSALRFSPSSYTSGSLYITAFGIELETGYGPS